MIAAVLTLGPVMWTLSTSLRSPSGALKYFQELSAEFPTGILELFSLPGLGAKKIKALHDRLGVSSIAQLQKACEEGRVAGLAGFGKQHSKRFVTPSPDAHRTLVHFNLGR